MKFEEEIVSLKTILRKNDSNEKLFKNYMSKM
jgi:hypothetical protein